MTDIDVALRVSGDAADAERAMRDLSLAARDMSEDVERAARDAARGMDGFQDGLDQTASTAAMAAGGLGDVAGGLELVGATGAAETLEKAAVAIQTVAGVADLATVATNLLSASKLRDTAITVKNRAAQIASAAATKATTAAQWLYNAALSANPLGLIILSVVALVAAFVLLYKKSDTFRALVQRVGAIGQRAIGWIVDKAGDLVGWVRDKLPGAFDRFKRIATTAIRYIPIVFLIRKGIELYGWVKDKLPGAWDRFKSVAVKAFNAIPIVFLIRKAGDLVDWIKVRLPGAFRTARETAVNVLDKITAPIRALIDFVDDLVSAIGDIDWPDPPDWVDDLGGAIGGLLRTTTTAPSLSPGLVPVANTTEIHINGALDPVAVARQINALLSGRARLIGATP